MNKYEVAKELTLAAINTGTINKNIENKGDYTTMNQDIAKNIAAFYNTLVEELKTINDR